jgi:hypothetical protein
MRRARRLLLTFAGIIPVMSAALVATTQGCGSDAARSDAAPGAQADAALGVDGSFGLGGGRSPDPPAAPLCPSPLVPTTFKVPFPVASVAPDATVLCAADVSPVRSNAAVVTVTSYDPSTGEARGHVSFDVPLVSVLGVSSITITTPAISTATNVTRVADGFTFDIVLPAAVLDAGPSWSVALVTFQLDCGAPQQVEAAWLLELCGLPGSRAWVSSGGQCIDCEPFTEVP